MCRHCCSVGRRIVSTGSDRVPDNPSFPRFLQGLGDGTSSGFLFGRVPRRHLYVGKEKATPCLSGQNRSLLFEDDRDAGLLLELCRLGDQKINDGSGK